MAKTIFIKTILSVEVAKFVSSLRLAEYVMIAAIPRDSVQKARPRASKSELNEILLKSGTSKNSADFVKPFIVIEKISMIKTMINRLGIIQTFSFSIPLFTPFERIKKQATNAITK